MLISNLLKKLQKVINEKVMENRVFDIDNSVQKFNFLYTFCMLYSSVKLGGSLLHVKSIIKI
jgi:hypothetical protein